MPQLCDFVINNEKPRDWHLYFLRELLQHVEQEKPTERRYMKWLRERKVFDRKLLAFTERLCGIDRMPLQAPQLGEVAKDLLAAIEKARAAVEKAAPPPPKKLGAAPRAANPDDELDEEKAFAEKPVEAVAGDDPFVKAVLERAVELHSYL